MLPSVGSYVLRNLGERSRGQRTIIEEPYRKARSYYKRKNQVSHLEKNKRGKSKEKNCEDITRKASKNACSPLNILTFIEQNFGPHMEQKWAFLPASESIVSS
jgi:hypothetical protein